MPLSQLEAVAKLPPASLIQLLVTAWAEGGLRWIETAAATSASVGAVKRRFDTTCALGFIQLSSFTLIGHELLATSASCDCRKGKSNNGQNHIWFGYRGCEGGKRLLIGGADRPGFA